MSPRLMRWALLRLGDQNFKLVWTFHHALLDGRSFPLLLEEVFQAYDDPGKSAATPPRPYREFIEWQRRLDTNASESFWRETLKGFTAPTYLPIIEPVSNSAERQQSSAEMRVSTAMTHQLVALAKENGVTLNTLVHGRVGAPAQPLQPGGRCGLWSHARLPPFHDRRRGSDPRTFHQHGSGAH